MSTNGATLGYLFHTAALPLTASQDNFIMKYDAYAKTISWEDVLDDDVGGYIYCPDCKERIDIKD